MIPTSSPSKRRNYPVFHTSLSPIIFKLLGELRISWFIRPSSADSSLVGCQASPISIHSWNNSSSSSSEASPMGNRALKTRLLMRQLKIVKWMTDKSISSSPQGSDIFCPRIRSPCTKIVCVRTTKPPTTKRHKKKKKKKTWVSQPKRTKSMITPNILPSAVQ